MRPSLVSVLTVLILLTGCEGSPVPLSKPDAALFDDSVLGSWVTGSGVEDDDTDRLYLRLFRFNEAEYYAESRTDADEPDEWMRLRIYPTEMEGVLFANIQCVGCDDREWLFFSYELRADGRLDVTSVIETFYQEDAAEVTSSAELRDAVASRMAGEQLFGGTQTFVRWADDPEQQ